MSLMGSLYTGVSGLQTSNNALNTTAHNMTNLDTVGYTRQQVAQGTRTYVAINNSQKTSWQQIGLGVNYSQTRQVRDMFLDKNYRRESGRSAFYDVSSAALEQIEGILGESNEGEEFSVALNNLWTSVQELSKDPTSSVNQNLFVTRSHEFITKASAVYSCLCDYQDSLNKSIMKDIDNINKYAREIEEINEHIVKIEAADIEHANDLRDQRNHRLDELAKLGNISYEEDDFGYVSVKFEGIDLVKGGVVNEIAAYEDPKTGFYTPYWTMLANLKYDMEGRVSVSREDIVGAEVFDLTRTVSSDLNTDVGSLRGILLARGDHRATYNELRDINPDGEFEEGWYDTNISQSIIMNIEAEFDQLINTVVSKINTILKEAAEGVGGPGESTYLRDTDGEPYQLFQMVSEEEGWTVGNLRINTLLRQNPSLLSFRLPDHSEDNETCEKLKAAFEETTTTDRDGNVIPLTLNPNVQTPVNIVNYYKNLVSQVANSGSVFREIQSSQTAATDALFGAREQIVGVSSDEELGNMIMFQNAYNASSRYINVIDEMMEHVLTRLGGA